MTQFFVFWRFFCCIFFMAFLPVEENKEVKQADGEDEKKVEIGEQDLGIYDWKFIKISLSDSLWPFGENLCVDFITDDKSKDRLYIFDICLSLQQNLLFLNDRFMALMPCRNMEAREISFAAHHEAISRTSSL